MKGSTGLSSSHLALGVIPYQSRQGAVCARCRDVYSKLVLVKKVGSPQESDEVGILSGFLEGDEFGLGSDQSLCLEKEIVDVTVAPGLGEGSP